MEKAKKILVNIARLLLGLCFVFSGFVKAIDPEGSAYKISDYLEVFHLTFFSGASLVLGVILAAFEFFLGTTLLLGIWKKTISWFAFLFLLVMTFFTLYLAIWNPVSDCGCFGDALVLSNWATFYKNIVLLLLAGVTFYWHDLHLEIFGRHTSRWCAYWCFLFPLLLSAFSYRHLPIIDFRPYKIGNHLADLMKMPAGAPTDSFETRFIYEKQGVKQEFSVEKAPVSDSAWTYVDRIEKQIRKGYTPPIHDFVVEHPKRGDITQEILNDTSYTFLLVSPNLEKANREGSDRIGAVQDYAEKHGYAFYGLTNSDAGVIDEWNYEYDSDIEYCSVDQRTLQTMIRSNPGLMLLKNGVVYQKWAFTDIPDLSKTKEPLDRLPFGKERVVSIMRNLVNIFLIYLVPLMFFYLVHTGHHFHFNFMKKKNLNNA